MWYTAGRHPVINYYYGFGTSFWILYAVKTAQSGRRSLLIFEMSTRVYERLNIQMWQSECIYVVTVCVRVCVCVREKKMERERERASE